MTARRVRYARVSRRQFLGRAGMFAGAVALGPGVLAACGGDDDDGTSSGGTGSGGTGGGGGGGADKLVISNWPLYIDPTEGDTLGTVDLFTEETGIDLTYTEDYNDNNEFFAKIQPDLAAGTPIAQDIIVPTFWLVARLIDLGWVEPLPLDQIPNAANLVPSLQKPSWDPDGEFSLPWQSGITGIAYNREAAGRELTSVGDLLDPEYKGKIGLLSEMRDTVGLFMLYTGEDPSTATFESAQPAFDVIDKAVQDEQIRQFTGNDYQTPLSNGDFVACVGWSGDVAQLALEDPNLEFIIPEEGGMRWSDCMVVPTGAANVAAAAEWMDYVYNPVTAARIAAYVGYISPVSGVQEELAKNPDTAALADSPLLFPDDATLENTFVFANLPDSEEAQFDEQFAEISKS